MNRPIASLSIDLDNVWSYMKTHGDPGWDTFPSYFDVAVPRILDVLEKHNLDITFFIVGQDAALEKNAEWLQEIASKNHEVGNHSFHHEPWLHLYSRQEMEADISQAEEHIHRVMGVKPIGFRGPGYSVSSTTVEILAERGYKYDASTLPTFIGPMARAYYFMKAKLNSSEKEKRDKLFGSISDGFRSIQPYRWSIDGNDDQSLLEIPVTTMPIFKVPIHFSYILYLAGYSDALALMYAKFSLSLCRLMGVAPSMLLHPLDFLGADDLKNLSFFPGMNLSSQRKIDVLRKVFTYMTQKFEVVKMQRHAEIISASKRRIPSKSSLLINP